MSDQNFSRLPKPHTTYANIIKSFLPIGDQDKSADAVLPNATYSVNTLEIDHDNLADYRRICGFENNSYVPPTYFAVLSQSLQMNMMVKEPFPFAMLGLIHVQNSVTQYRRIKDSAVFRMAVSFANLRDHDRGKQFDFVTKVFEKDELVWEGTSTYLSRQKTELSVKAANAVKSDQATEQNPTDYQLQGVWDIAENIGRRYALTSGDFNLIHIHAITAKAFGFKQAIAHGMWSKAKALASLTLPDRYEADVWFKLPMYLPSKVEFVTAVQHQQTAFLIRNAKSQKPHVAGMLKSL